MNFRSSDCPFSQPNELLGRDAMLRMLMTRMHTESRILLGVDPALQCRTGVGRSTLLRTLADRVSSLFKHTLCLQAGSPIQWSGSLLGAARQLDLRQQEFRRKSDLTGAIRGWLSHQDRWLLLIDQVSDLDEITELLQGVGNGHVIVVLQNPLESAVEGWSAPLPIGTLSPDDAAAILRKSAGLQSEQKDLEQTLPLAGLIEGNPLCAELAGQLIAAGVLPVDQLRELLQEGRESSPLTTLLGTAISWLETVAPDALVILAAAVLLSPNPLSVNHLSGLERRLSASADLLKWNTSLGLIRRTPDAAFEVPAGPELKALLPLPVQSRAAQLLAELIPSPRRRQRLRELVCGDYEDHDDAPRDTMDAAVESQVARFFASQPSLSTSDIELIRRGADSTIELLVPEIGQQLWQRVLDHSTRAGRPESELLNSLVQLGVHCHAGDKQQLARRRWRQAVDLCPVEHPLLMELLLAIAESDVNDNRFDKAEIRLNRIAKICSAQPSSSHLTLLLAQLEYLQGGVAIGLGRYQQAHQHFQSSIQRRSGLLPADHPLLMKSRLMLARVEFLLKDFAACEDLLKAEVVIRESSRRVSDSDLGVALNFLGEQYYLSGRHAMAEPVYERAIEIRRLTYPRGHRLMGEMANRLAVIKSASGNYLESDPLFREALACLEETYGPEHPEVSRALNDLAESLFAQNKLEPARRLLERALNIQERSLRVNDARISRTRSNLAAVYVARGRYPEAVRLYEKDISLRQSQSLPDRTALATSLNNLAEALRSLGRYSEAEKCLIQALGLREQLVGKEHPHVAQILSNLGYLYLHQHRHDEAIELLERALRVRESCLSPNHPQIMTTLGTLAEVRFSAGQYAEARPHFVRALQIAQSTFGERHPQVLGLQVASARNEFRLGHLGRAELMLNRSRSVIDEVLGPDHRVSARCMLGLAELAQKEKRYDAAFPWLERSLAIVQTTTACARREHAEILRLIAENLFARNLPVEALERAEQLAEIQREILPPDHGDVIHTWQLLGTLKQLLKNPLGAEAAYRKALDLQGKNPDEAIAARLADVLVEQGKYSDGHAVLNGLIGSCQERGDRNSLLRLLSQQAGVCYLESQYENAAQLMERCVRSAKSSSGLTLPKRPVIWRIWLERDSCWASSIPPNRPSSGLSIFWSRKHRSERRHWPRRVRTTPSCFGVQAVLRRPIGSVSRTRANRNQQPHPRCLIPMSWTISRRISNDRIYRAW